MLIEKGVCMKFSKRIIWVILGFLSLAVGTLGVLLPGLPTVPFFLATGCCFAKGSKRIHDWFLQTKLYRNHFECFHARREMALRTKCTILCSVTLMMGIGFVLMEGIWVGRVALVIVWAFHMYYFFVRVKTVRNEEERGTLYD